MQSDSTTTEVKSWDVYLEGSLNMDRLFIQLLGS